MKLSVTEKKDIPRANMAWLMFAQSVSVLPLFFYLPVWIAVAWGGALFWRIQIHRGIWFFPSFPVKLALAVASVLGIFVSFTGQISAEPMIAFLICAFILKIIEMHSKRDALIVLFIGFIALSTQFLMAQDILAGLYGFFSIFALTSSWYAVYCSKKLSLLNHFKTGGIVVLQSAPFLIVLFVVMPRLGPLWNVPIPHQGQGRMGFSDSLKLGDISELVQSPEVAFRVTFEGRNPEVNKLYWRGLVLDDFDGVRWNPTILPSRKIQPPPADLSQLSQNTLIYSVVVEPHYYRWLFALGKPLFAHSGSDTLQTNAQNLLYSRNVVASKTEYQVISELRGVDVSTPLDDRARYLALPVAVNPKARDLALNWRSELEREDQIVTAALQYYNEGFSYSLRPNGATDNAIDAFLFESKRGFCEHFASSFVFLMRSAGIPARIVLGYQGGEYNKGDNYFVVRQLHAHAWAEIWIENSGWQVVDPTAAVAPDRIELGIVEALTGEDRDLIGSNWQAGLLHKLAQQWDSVGYSWNRWVLNYNKSRQDGFFQKFLGSSSPWRVGLAFSIFCSAVFGLYILIQKIKTRKIFKYPEDQIVLPLVKKLSREQLLRARHESFPVFVRRVAANLGQSDHAALSRIAQLYEAGVYAGKSSRGDQAQLRTAVHSFLQGQKKATILRSPAR